MKDELTRNGANLAVNPMPKIRHALNSVTAALAKDWIRHSQCYPPACWT